MAKKPKAEKVEVVEAEQPEVVEVEQPEDVKQSTVTVRATRGNHHVNGKLTVTGEPVSVPSALLSNALFMKHLTHSIRTGALEQV